MNSPKEILLNGSRVLDGVLRPAGFVFEFRGDGRGSGGDFAWGEYIRDTRRLELHFRFSLGLVTYHDCENHASHEPYMRGLGVWEQCRYGRVVSMPLDAFSDLAADLKFAQDFLAGDTSILREVAFQQSRREAERNEELMVRAVGDTASRARMRNLFRAGSYREVLETFHSLQYPQRLSPSELKLVEVSRQRCV